MSRPSPGQGPLLAALVVHWNCEAQLFQLLEAWPRGDPRFELLVIDNGSTVPLAAANENPGVRVLPAGGNRGFAGGLNLGLAASESPLVLLLNPDAHPREGALEELLAGFDRHPEAAGLAPRLESPDGEPQHRWQLRRLPSPGELLLETLLVPMPRGAHTEPAAGTPVEQPAAAALALRRAVLTELGGLDERFHPAWFEDVDLGRRLKNAGHRLLYWPRCRFQHALGSSLPRLGYGAFLWIYYRNLIRYLAKHHGLVWAAAARGLLPLGAKVRLVALPLRRPRRAGSRLEAARGLLGLAVGALSGWQRPRELAAGSLWDGGGEAHHALGPTRGPAASRKEQRG